MHASVHALGSLVPIFLNIDSCPPPLAHASSMTSPLKVWSFAAAKPGASNIHAVILIISFFIFFFLRIELLLETLSVLVAAKASSRLGHHVENCLPLGFVRQFFSICSIGFADRLVIARLAVPPVGQNRDGQRRNIQEEF